MGVGLAKEPSSVAELLALSLPPEPVVEAAFGGWERVAVESGVGT